MIFIYLFSAQLISFVRNEHNKPDTGGISLSEYKLVRKRLFIKVDFPRPDSPEKYNIVKLVSEFGEQMIVFQVSNNNILN